MQSLLSLSVEIDELHNEYNRVFGYEKSIQSGHWLSSRIKQKMETKQKELDNFISRNLRGYKHVEEVISVFDVRA